MTLRKTAPMPMRRLRTADYDEPARQRLADAVASARDAAGYRHRTEFALRANVSVRSIAALESAEPVVGQRTLWAVADALGWDKGVPKAILEGAEPPVLGQVTAVPRPHTVDRIDVTELLGHLHVGGPEPSQDDLVRRLDIRGAVEAEIIGLTSVSLVKRLVAILVLRNKSAVRPGGESGNQTSA